MVAQKIYLAFLWHQHQPYYKLVNENKFLMPWVRLHGTKDYLDMPLLLKDYPKIKANFNLVPSLIEQINEYVNNGAKDRILELTLIKARELKEEERVEVLQLFFTASYENMIRKFPQYDYLYQKRGYKKSYEELIETQRFFTAQEILDLQVLFNLVWIDPLLRERDDFLKSLVKKGKGYTEEEKIKLVDKHLEILRNIIPLHKEMQESGQIEVTTTPYYHPIFPLLINNYIAKVSNPKIKLPESNFKFPEDAEHHLKEAINIYKNMFGVEPKGIWPAEGSVSEDIVPILSKYSVKWIATDEEILAQSLGIGYFPRDRDGITQNMEMLYQPYSFEKDGHKINLIFRDHYLSDSFGFKYQNMSESDAVNDFMNRIRFIQKSLKPSEKPYLVSIILDGENCWEYYQNDGIDFLKKLYEALSNDKSIETVTISDFLEKFPPSKKLPKLFPGSWINHNFNIWIGHEEDNKSWDCLYNTRKTLVDFIKSHLELSEDVKEKAWKEIYIAEGSDWNWWYGDDHFSGYDDEFDEIYRSHLINVYRLIGTDIPACLNLPINRREVKIQYTMPKSLISPVIDGIVTDYYEWYDAGSFDPSKVGGAMHQASGLITQIYFGFSMEKFFFRIDTNLNLKKNPEDISFAVDIVNPINRRFLVKYNVEKGDFFGQIFLRDEFSNWKETEKDFKVVVKSCVEVEIPFSMLDVKENTEVEFQIALKIKGKTIERLPHKSTIKLTIPDKDFEAKQWIV